MNLSRYVILVSLIACLPAASIAALPIHNSDLTAPTIDPHANPRAVVIAGHARFTVLTPELIRMEWAADEKFEDHASLIFLNRRMPVPAFHTEQKDGTLTIDTGKLKLLYRMNEGNFTAKNLSVSLEVGGEAVTWHPGMPATGNLLGTTRTLDGARGEKDLREPMGLGLVSRDGWAVVDDHGPLFDATNFNAEHASPMTQPWVIERPAGERSDLYFFGYGHKYRQAMGDYVRVAGKIPLPPRFAFGTWWSRYWAYSDQELKDLVTGFHQNNVPLDVLVIDMDWHKTFGRTFTTNDASGHPKGWSGYSWDKALFPDPKDFLGELHEEGLKVTLNLHPASGVQPWEDAYPQFARNMGVDPASKKYIPFDLTNRKFATNYMDLLHHPLEHEGVDFWWLDWQQESQTKTAGVNPTWWLNYIHFTDQEHEGKRPLLFHRWGGLGNHRYQIGFSGDTVSVWDSLAFQPWFTATAANVGYAYWSHDIGGHMPGAVDPELYTRWIQFGAFSPILRTHTTKNPEAERRIWAYPEPYSDAMRTTFQLRYAMQPYIYTEARRTYDTGVAFVHPLYYDWPEAPDAYTSRDEYMFGNSLLVAPVVKPANPTTGLATEKVWLPRGEWMEWATGTHFTGPVTVDRSYAIDQLPVFVKEGAIIPMEPPMLYTEQKPVDPLILTIFPLKDGSRSTYTVYEDSGLAEDYQRNQGTAWTDVSAKQSGDSLRVTIAPVRGGYASMEKRRGLELRLPADWPPASVTANGVPVHYAPDARKAGWRFEGDTLTTVILIKPVDVHSETTIVIRRADEAISKRSMLDGFSGKVKRLREAYDALSMDYPRTRAVPDDLTLAMQTGDRIGYHPDTANTEITGLSAQYAKAVAATMALKNTASGLSTTPEKEHAARLQHALADLEDGKPSE